MPGAGQGTADEVSKITAAPPITLPSYPYLDAKEEDVFGQAVYDPECHNRFGWMPLEVVLMEVLRFLVCQLQSQQQCGEEHLIGAVSTDTPAADAHKASGTKNTASGSSTPIPSASTTTNPPSSVGGLNIRSARLTEALKLRQQSQQISGSRGGGGGGSTDHTKFIRHSSSRATSRKYEACLDLLTNLLFLIKHLRDQALASFEAVGIPKAEEIDNRLQEEALAVKLQRLNLSLTLALRAISLTTAAYQDSSLRKLDRSRPLPFVTGRRRRQRQAMLQATPPV